MGKRIDSDDDGLLEAWPEEPPRSLDDEAIDRAVLPGGATREEIAELVRQMSAEAAADSQAAMSAEQRAEKTKLDERYWDTVGLPITVSRSRNRRRPDVVARFAALTEVEDRRTSSSSYWVVAGLLAWTDAGELVAPQLTLGPRLDDWGGLTPDVLRAVSVPQIIARAQAAMRLAPEFASFARRVGLRRDAADAEAEASEAEAVALAGVADAPPRRTGRQALGDDYYRWVAETYLELQDAGVGRGILIRLAELASVREGREVSRQMMRDRVHRSRRLRFLEGSTQGRAGARPGPRLQRTARAKRDAGEENDDG